jgi:hypothetical protein
MDSEDLVLICTVQSPTEAELIRSALKSVGIACQIGGEGQAGFAGVFEIDLLTHASDVDEARKYLRKLRREKLQRKKKRAEKRKAKAEGKPSEAIQELPPRKRPPSAPK